MRELNDEELKYVQNETFKLLCAFKEVCEKENIWYSLAYGSVLGAIRHKGFIPWDSDADVFIFLPDKEKFREAFKKHKPEGIKLNNHNEEKKCLQSHDMLIFEEEKLIPDIHLDIFPLVGAPSEEKEQRKFARYCKYSDKIIRSKYVRLRDCKNKNKPLVVCAKIIDYLIPNKYLRKNIYKREHKYDFHKSNYLITLSTYGRVSDCVPKTIYEKTCKVEFNGEYFCIPEEWDAYLKRIYGDDYMTPKKY